MLRKMPEQRNPLHLTPNPGSKRLVRRLGSCFALNSSDILALDREQPRRILTAKLRSCRDRAPFPAKSVILSGQREIGQWLSTPEVFYDGLADRNWEDFQRFRRK
jgi:hypothetical protein